MTSTVLASKDAPKKTKEQTIAAAEQVLRQWAGKDDARLDKELAKLGWQLLPSEPDTSTCLLPVLEP